MFIMHSICCTVTSLNVGISENWNFLSQNKIKVGKCSPKSKKNLIFVIFFWFLIRIGTQKIRIFLQGDFWLKIRTFSPKNQKNSEWENVSWKIISVLQQKLSTFWNFLHFRGHFQLDIGKLPENHKHSDIERKFLKGKILQSQKVRFVQQLAFRRIYSIYCILLMHSQDFSSWQLLVLIYFTIHG